MEVQTEKTIILINPIEVGGVTYAELVLREPTAGELLKSTSKSASWVETCILLISAIAGVPRGVVEKLCQRDFQECCSFLGSFAAAGQEIGEALSQT